MELYHIKKYGKRAETFVKVGFPNEIDKHGLLRWFEYGKGYQKTKLYEKVDVDIEPKKDALYIGEVCDKYGSSVAVELCENAFDCCTMSARSWVIVFHNAYRVAMESFTESEREQIAREVVNEFRCFFGMLDVLRLDKRLSEMDAEYDCNQCTYKGESGVSMEKYIREKYGNVTAKFVKKCISM